MPGVLVEGCLFFGIIELWSCWEWKFFFVVGNGRRVKFWIDKWCGDEPFRVSFPSLYALTVSKEAWVANHRVQLGERGHWNHCFSRKR